MLNSDVEHFFDRISLYPDKEFNRSKYDYSIFLEL